MSFTLNPCTIYWRRFAFAHPPCDSWRRGQECSDSFREAAIDFDFQGERHMRDLNGRIAGFILLSVCAMAAPVDAQTGASTQPLASVSSGSGTKALSAPAFDVGQVVQQPAGPPPTPRHTGFKAMLKSLGSDVEHLPSKENLPARFVRGHLSYAGKSPLAERRGVWCRGRHYCRPDRDEPRSTEVSGGHYLCAGRGRPHVRPQRAIASVRPSREVIQKA